MKTNLRRCRILYFSKPYSNGRSGQAEVRYCDEREWRFVREEIPGFVRWPSEARLPTAYILTPGEAGRSAGPPVPLSFEEVRYIVVATDDDILPMMEALAKAAGRRITHDAARILQSRIISAAQVHEDS